MPGGMQGQEREQAGGNKEDLLGLEWLQSAINQADDILSRGCPLLLSMASKPLLFRLAIIETHIMQRLLPAVIGFEPDL